MTHMQMGDLTFFPSAAIHNGTVHGKQDAHLHMKLSYTESQLRIALENEPGPQHSIALAMQHRHGENFVIRNARGRGNKSSIDINTIANDQSTLLGCREMAQAADLMDADLSLVFSQSKVTLAMNLLCHECPAVEVQENELSLPSNSVLVCAGGWLAELTVTFKLLF